MNLYRIISIESFIDLLHNKRERYVRPALWDDNYEGYLFTKINNEEDRRKIIEDMYYNVCPRNYKATINNLFKLEHVKQFVYGQCWSTLSDSDALWRIYSYGKHSIQIRTTEARIDNLLKRVSDIKYELRKVIYDVETDDDLMHKQVIQLKSTLSTYEPFLHKRKAFKHEAERRVLIDDIRWFQMSEMDCMSANWKINEKMQEIENDADRIEEIERRLNQYMGHWEDERIAKDYYVKIDKLNEYISGVKVNPFAEDWYVELIRGLCKEYDIKFEGKSGLYM